MHKDLYLMPGIKVLAIGKWFVQVVSLYEVLLRAVLIGEAEADKPQYNR